MNSEEKDNVIRFPIPTFPLPDVIPYGTPSPEDTLIEILDDEKKNKDKRSSV